MWMLCRMYLCNNYPNNIEGTDCTVTLYAVIIFYVLIGSKLNQQLYSYVSITHLSHLIGTCSNYKSYNYDGIADVHVVGRACPLSKPRHYLTILGKTAVVAAAQPAGQHWALVSNEALNASNKFIIASYPSLDKVLYIGSVFYYGGQKYYYVYVYKLPYNYRYIHGYKFLDLGSHFHFTLVDVAVGDEDRVQIKHVDTGLVLEHLDGYYYGSGASDEPDQVVAAPPAYPKYGKGCTCTPVWTVANQAWNLYD